MPTPTTIEPLNQHEEAFLRVLGRVMTRLPRVVDADMLQEQPITGGEYMVLVHLSEAPDNHLRMSEVAHACGLSLSGMTRVVDRLESRSLVLPEVPGGRAGLARRAHQFRLDAAETGVAHESCERATSPLPPSGRLRHRCGHAGAGAHSPHVTEARRGPSTGYHLDG
ncbi:MarR family winged helix-turn-helix transcriptional regulator [Streptomyces spiralis]